jgi:hypothetical protein
MTRTWYGRGRPRYDGPREFVISTSIGRLRVAECHLCGALVVMDDGQLQHVRYPRRRTRSASRGLAGRRPGRDDEGRLVRGPHRLYGLLAVAFAAAAAVWLMGRRSRPCGARSNKSVS